MLKELGLGRLGSPPSSRTTSPDIGEGDCISPSSPSSTEHLQQEGGGFNLMKATEDSQPAQCSPQSAAPSSSTVPVAFPHTCSRGSLMRGIAPPIFLTVRPAKLAWGAAESNTSNKLPRVTDSPTLHSAVDHSSMTASAPQRSGSSLWLGSFSPSIPLPTPPCSPPSLGPSWSIRACLRHPAVQLSLQLSVALLAYFLPSVVYDFRAAPWFVSGAACFAVALLVFVSLGARIMVRVTCLLLLAFNLITVCGRSILRSPSELIEGLEKTQRSSPYLAIFSLVMGAFLGGQPDDFLSIKVKRLFISLWSALRVLGLATMASRTGRLSLVMVIYAWVDVPFWASFLAGVTKAQRWRQWSVAHVAPQRERLIET